VQSSASLTGHGRGEGIRGERTRIHVDDKEVHPQRSSDGGASGKRRCHGRRLERRLDAAVANDAAGAGIRDDDDAGKSLAGQRAGGEEPAGANESKVAGTDDHAVAGTGKLDGAPRHRQNVHRDAERPGR